MPWPAAILFDFDGVLVNSEPLHFEAFQQTARTIGIELDLDFYINHLIGFDDRGAFRQLAQIHQKPLTPAQLLELIATKSRAMRKLIDSRRYTALPGVEQLVRGLWRRYPLAICTGALRDEVEAMLEGIRLRDCFRVVTAAEDVSNGKPHPEGYLKTAGELARLTGRRIDASNSLIFEDSPKVIEQARKAGFKTVGVPTSFGHDQLNADYATREMTINAVKAALPQLSIFREPE